MKYPGNNIWAILLLFLNMSIACLSQDTMLCVGRHWTEDEANLTMKKFARTWNYLESREKHANTEEVCEIDPKGTGPFIWASMEYETYKGINPDPSQRQIAFPGAEGFGAYARGGRGGKVIYVDNLNESGPGSLRAAVEDTVPRMVIFKVSGTIELKSHFIISSPYITIAGQTAPGDGICLKNYPLQVKGTHDVIVRYIRVRPGIESGLGGSSLDAISIRDCQNVILDHCSASWSSDEILNTWHRSRDITIQWCIFSEALNKSVHIKTDHGYSASIGGIRASYHHNLFAHGAGRNPSVGGDNDDTTLMVDFRNNVVFNWKQRSCDGKPRTMNFAGNYYKPGPATPEAVKRRLVKIDNARKYGYDAKWYIEGNVIEGYPELSNDNWNGAIDFDPGTSPEINRSLSPFYNAGYITEEAEVAYRNVLQYAGVIFPGRDDIEKRIIAEVRSGKPTIGDGIIDRVEQAGGWPKLKSLAVPRDSDKDGMPDAWEIINGLNPKDPGDQNEDFNGNGYTNLEKYINGLVDK